MHPSVTALAVGLALLVSSSSSRAASASAIKTFLLGRIVLCEDYLFEIRFNRKGTADLLMDRIETVERVPASGLTWSPDSVTLRRKQGGTLKFYVGTGPSPKLLVDINEEGGILSDMGRKRGDSRSRTDTSAEQRVCEVTK